jgi:glycosyltransferase involved in cell wall biosynthesis
LKNCKENISIEYASKLNNVVIYAGSLGNGVDIETVISLGANRPDLRIIIAGSGPKSLMCIEAHNKGIIEYLGQLNSSELSNLYKTATFGILPYNKYSAVSMPIKFYDYICC